MSSSQSHSSVYSDVSSSMPYEVEDELKESEKSSIVADREYGNIDDDGDSDMEAYFDEPIADEPWLAEYHRKREEDEERMQQLQLRFGGSEPVMTW